MKNIHHLKSATCAIMLLSVPCALLAQAEAEPHNTNVDIVPTDSIIHLKSVTVTANRQVDKRMTVVQQVHPISAEDILFANAQTTGDLLATNGMLTVQKSQQGGGSPVIRGFEASRVLLVVDGVRLNNLIYRSGHLQNVITVDQSMLQRAEVLYGPASVTYGGGALGGAVVFQTKMPTLAQVNKTAYNGSAFMRYGSANNETTGHFDFSIGNHKFASLTSFTYSRFGDLRAGADKNPFADKNDSYIHRPWDVKRFDGKDVLTDNKNLAVQLGSGYTQFDILQKFLWRPTSEQSHLLNFQLSNSSDINRYDRLTDRKGDKPKFAEWYYGPQFRLLGAYTFKGDRMLGADNITATIAYQNIAESRHNRKFNNSKLGHRQERVNVVSLTSDWTKALTTAYHLHLGIDGALNFLKSTAHTTDVVTGEIGTLDTRYPDGENHQHNIEAFVLNNWQISSTLSMSGGARLGFSTLHSSFISSEFFPFLGQDVKEVTQNNFTYSFDLGLNYKPAPDWRLALSASTGYYVPNIDDVGKVFDSQPGMVVVPNPYIKPEQTINVDLNITRMHSDSFLWETVIFSTYLFDAITLRPATFNGQSQILYDGEMSNVYCNANNRHAWLCGVTTHLNWTIGRGFATDATVSYTYGDVTDGDNKTMPLDHVPPLYGRIGLSYTIPTKTAFFEVYSNFNGSKPLSRYNLNGEDNIGYATTLANDGKGLPAWFTLNLKAMWNATPNISLQASLENILDTEYRTFGSGISAPGRNLLTTLRVKF